MKIGFIGCGNMGGALALAVGKTENALLLSDHNKNKVSALIGKIGKNAETATTEEAAKRADVLFLGVKPQAYPALAAELSPRLAGRGLLLVSMMAGVSLETLEKDFPATRVVRIMPNTPVAVGEGMIFLCPGARATDEDVSCLSSLLSQAGKLDTIPEKLIDAASAVAGCGPAFACVFIEALADGGVRLGLPRKKALAYAEQMLLGTAKLVAESGEHPAALKDAVCSPGGTTIEGIAALEAGGFRSAVIEAVTATHRKAEALAKK